MVINRGDAIHEKELEEQLDLELADWRTRVVEAVAAFDQAKARLDQPMAAEESRELRDLYRRLVKRLHPDLHADRNVNFGTGAKVLYDRADLEELRALAIVQPDSALSGMKNSIGELQEKRDALKGYVTRLFSEIERITSQPPFTLRKPLEDAEWIEEMRKTIDGECAQLEVERAELETHVAGEERVGRAAVPLPVAEIETARAGGEALARLMDAGKLLFGRLESKEWQGSWLKAGIRIYLRDF